MEQHGNRLCIIDDNTFIFYPNGKQYMNVFAMNSTNKQSTKIKDIPSKKKGTNNWLFAQQYIKSKCILCFICEFNEEKTKWRCYTRVIY
ncbi:unnamed protein product [Paramecium sonneborni]|uniref:Uncharacterized protein n=1 Tax=Paramecium sonneborni TaxID=65129 RepID=A0A8S1Q2X6_9CILI|nr:unnamed protein product [Paramecium sonneborni]